MIGAIAVLLAFVAAGVGAIVMVRRRPADPVTQFRRQIDALSAESRRSVKSQRSGSTGVHTLAPDADRDAAPSADDIEIAGAEPQTSPDVAVPPLDSADDDASSQSAPGSP